MEAKEIESMLSGGETPEGLLTEIQNWLNDNVQRIVSSALDDALSDLFQKSH
ncbi:hypothetical protein WDW89_16450 [Deltaproteobacteria bacterium TL4]